MKNTKRLGKGLSALLGENQDFSQSNKNSIESIHIDSIFPNPKQPRNIFDKEKLNELAQSIKQVGIIEPVLVYKDNNKYILIAGERRWRAAKISGYSHIPAIVKSVDSIENNVFELMLIENIQREDLTPIEEAVCLSQILETKKLTHEQLAQIIGKSRSHVTNSLRILKLPAEIQNAINNKTISTGHAKILAGLDSTEQMSAFKKLLNEKSSVHAFHADNKAASDVPRGTLKNPDIAGNSKKSSIIKIKENILELENALQEKFKTKVLIKVSNKYSGVVQFSVYNAQDLDILYHKLIR